MDERLTELTLYTKDSGNVTLLVHHCDHNKSYSSNEIVYPYVFVRYTAKKGFQGLENALLIFENLFESFRDFRSP